MHKKAPHLTTLLIIAVMSLGFAGCQNAYYSGWEKLGWHKRDILVDRIEDARDEQEEAKKVFSSALEQFQSVMQVDGGKLQKAYNKFKKQYEAGADQAQEVRDRIKSVESVAVALFKEWEAELDQYDSPTLRVQSAQQLEQTQKRYSDLIGAMQRASQKMDPVLATFKDQVLVLKHSLNAQAIASLQSSAISVEQDVQRLIAEMQTAIDQANEFINDMTRD